MNARSSAVIFSAALAAFAFVAGSVSAEEPKLPKWVTDTGDVWQPPPDGVVRDQKAAISIARAVWFSMRSDNTGPLPSDEDWQKTMDATLKDGVWEVTEPMKPGEIGGSLFIFISQKDARVLDVFLTQ